MNKTSAKITIRKRDGEIHCNEFTVRSNLIVDGAIKPRSATMITIPSHVETTGIVTVGGVVSSTSGSVPGMATFTGLLGASPEFAVGVNNQIRRVNIYCLDATTGLRAGTALDNTLASAQVGSQTN